MRKNNRRNNIVHDWQIKKPYEDKNGRKGTISVQSDTCQACGIRREKATDRSGYKYYLENNEIVFSAPECIKPQI